MLSFINECDIAIWHNYTGKMCIRGCVVSSDIYDPVANCRRLPRKNVITPYMRKELTSYELERITPKVDYQEELYKAESCYELQRITSHLKAYLNVEKLTYELRIVEDYPERGKQG